MKKTRKALCIVLAVVLMLGVMPVSLAAGEGSITINKPAGSSVSISGKTFYAFKVFDVEYNASKTAYLYTIDSDFSTFADYPDSGTQTLAEYLSGATGNSGELHNVTRLLLAHAWDEGVTPDASGTVAGGSETVTISGLDLGYYLVSEFATAPGASFPSGPISAAMLTTTDPSVTVEAKMDAPSLTKKVWDVQDDVDASPGSTSWRDITDVNIKDTVNFKLNSAVPDVNGYNGYDFVIHDQMSAGLTFDPSSVVVKIGGNTMTLNTEYSIDTNGPYLDGSSNPVAPCTAACTFHLHFYLLDGNSEPLYAKGTAIEITYSATLNEDAVVAGMGNPNAVFLQYTRNPYNHKDTDVTPKDEVVVFTFPIDVFKYAASGTDAKRPLAGAEFQLYASDDDGDKLNAPMYMVKTNGTGNTYRPALSTETGATQTMVSPDGGHIYITGVDEGTYYLTETKAPAGYNSLSADVVITVAVDYLINEGIGANDHYVYGAVATEQYEGTGIDKAGWYTMEVLNSAGNLFPETGGIGTIIFIVIGAALMIGAVVLLIAKRKTGRDE